MQRGRGSTRPFLLRGHENPDTIYAGLTKPQQELFDCFFAFKGTHVRIRTKIFALVGALSLLIIAISGVGVATVGTYHRAVDDMTAASTRALYSERLNHLVTAVVMESRGIYAAKDTQAAKQFGQGILKLLAEIDRLLAQWEPIVPADHRSAFEKVKREAAGFKAFRTETARLGVEVSPQAGNEHGNNEANRANRKA
jgi:methyl-accepting chemotaxis protein